MSEQNTMQAAAATREPEVVAETVVRMDNDRYRVAVLRVDHQHRWQIERNGVVVAWREGARPEGWPGEFFPSVVQDAVTEVALRLSW